MDEQRREGSVVVRGNKGGEVTRREIVYGTINGSRRSRESSSESGALSARREFGNGIVMGCRNEGDRRERERTNERTLEMVPDGWEEWSGGEEGEKRGREGEFRRISTWEVC